MSDATPMDFEARVAAALSPVEPPPTLADRLEARLSGMSETAKEELDAFELRAMKDPRNWIRPVAAGTVAAVAGTGLVILRLRTRTPPGRLASASRKLNLRLPGR